MKVNINEVAKLSGIKVNEDKLPSITNFKAFFKDLVDRANGAGSDLDFAVELSGISGDTAQVIGYKSDDNDPEHTEASVQYIGVMHDNYMIKVTIDDEVMIMSASGTNLLRCLYV